MTRVASVRVLTVFSILIATSTAAARDTYLKGSFLLHVDSAGDVDAGDRWGISAGSDWAFHPVGHLGVEVQSAYRHDRIGGKVDARFVPLNVFFNGKWKSSATGIRPYLGGGVGLVSALVWTKVSVPGFPPRFTYERRAGFQFMGGVEARRRWLIELLVERSFSTVGSVEVNPVGPEIGLSLCGGVTW